MDALNARAVAWLRGRCSARRREAAAGRASADDLKQPSPEKSRAGSAGAQAVRLDPTGSRETLPGRAAPHARAALAVRPGEPPLAMLAHSRATVAARHADGPANAMIGCTSRASHPSHARVLVVRGEQAERYHQASVQAGVTDGAKTVSNPPRERRARDPLEAGRRRRGSNSQAPRRRAYPAGVPRARSPRPPLQTAVHSRLDAAVCGPSLDLPKASTGCIRTRRVERSQQGQHRRPRPLANAWPSRRWRPTPVPDAASIVRERHVRTLASRSRSRRRRAVGRRARCSSDAGTS
jgi:hypothetical protein